MKQKQSVTADAGENEGPLRDEELDAVNVGVARALGGPDTRPDAAHKTTICIATQCYEWPL